MAKRTKNIFWKLVDEYATGSDYAPLEFTNLFNVGLSVCHYMAEFVIIAIIRTYMYVLLRKLLVGDGMGVQSNTFKQKEYSYYAKKFTSPRCRPSYTYVMYVRKCKYM